MVLMLESKKHISIIISATIRFDIFNFCKFSVKGNITKNTKLIKSARSHFSESVALEKYIANELIGNDLPEIEEEEKIKIKLYSDKITSKSYHSNFDNPQVQVLSIKFKFKSQ